MEEAEVGAAWPGDEAPISNIQIKFPPFDVKSVHPSVNLPAGFEVKSEQSARKVSSSTIAVCKHGSRSGLQSSTVGNSRPNGSSHVRFFELKRG
jgi:hypothetical protein